MNSTVFIIVLLVLVATGVLWAGIKLFIRLVVSAFLGGAVYGGLGVKWQTFFDGEGFYSLPFGGYDAGLRDMAASYAVLVAGFFVVLSFGGFVLGRMFSSDTDE